MNISRRTVTLGLGATALSGCMGGVAGLPAEAATGHDLRMLPDPGFLAWVQEFRILALQKGISPGVYDNAFRGVGYMPGVIHEDRNQPEVRRTVEDYLAIAAKDERVSKGRALLVRHQGMLSDIEARFGLEPKVAVAVWGMESFYGEKRGDWPVIAAMATLTFDGRRRALFQAQLLDALRILEAGDAMPGQMVGSWAGAMGHTQTMPSVYTDYGIDLRGDGRREVWSDDPTDSLATTANYFKRHGWKHGQPWGTEVQVPAGVKTDGLKLLPSAWAAKGVRDMNGRAVPDHAEAQVLQPAGAGKPAFMVFRNFHVIRRYNSPVKYGLGIGHLSDRLAGGPPIRGDFGKDAQGMTIADRKELQARLTAKGFDTKGADGVVGDRTRAAVRAFEKANSLPVTGEPTLELLARLR